LPADPPLSLATSLMQLRRSVQRDLDVLLDARRR
jgi:predicted component of type VI protein secretion system